MGSLLEQRTPLIQAVTFGMQSPPGRPSRFCGLVGVRPLTIILGLTEIFFILMQALIAGSYLLSSSHRTAAMIHMTVVVLAFIAVFLLLAGIMWRVPLLLGPHLVMQLIVTVVLLFITTGSVWCIVSGTSIQLRVSLVHAQVPISLSEIASVNSFKFTQISSFLAGLLVLVAVGYLLACLFSMWYLRVVLDCYRSLSYSLQDKAELPTMVTPVLGSDPKLHPVLPATDF